MRAHGTRVCYVFGPGPGRGKGCRCDPCKAANREAWAAIAEGRRRPFAVRGFPDGRWEVRERLGRTDGSTVHWTRDRGEAFEVRDELNRRYGRPDPVWLSEAEVAEVRDHVRSLAAAGMGLKGVAKAAGVNPKTVTAIDLGRDPAPDRDRGQGHKPRFHRGGPYRVRRATGDRLLRITLADALDGHNVDAGPTWERLETLVRAGYPKVQLARLIGQRGPGLQVGRTTVFARTERKVHEVYDRLLREDPRVRLAAEGSVFRRRINDRWGANARRGSEAASA